MFNPCYPFTAELLEAMVQKKVVHFVRSTHRRGNSFAGENRNALLISHYHQLAEAERHFNAIRTDPYRFLYNACLPEHVEQLRAATASPEDHPLFSKIFVPGIEKRITKLFAENTRRYVSKHTHWELKGQVRIVPFLYFQLGELYCRISHGGDEIKFKFEELENS